MTSSLSRTSAPIRFTATTLLRTCIGLTRAILGSSPKSSTPSTQVVKALTHQTVSSIRIPQSKVSRSRGVVLPFEQQTSSLPFDEFQLQFQRIKARIEIKGGNREKLLIRYLNACDPVNRRANYLLEANYKALKNYFDGADFRA